ncbi:MAG: two-component system response regulator [Desulfuromonas sp.]|nr:MAG: two-component system response regulator [Desulfuromonas sp.]
MSRKVLIVDESELVREELCATLIDAGYDVEAADDSEAALQVISSDHYDMLMAEQNMPHMSCAEFITAVRNIPGRRYVPIVILSQGGDEVKFSECAKAGASGFINKPFEKDQVLDVVKMILPY